jgi:prolyl-tRNA synthetase
MAEEKLPTRAENFSEWYNQLVLKSELADYAPVRGCMVVRPYGWTLWENITAALDSRFKATGHVNAAFPILIPMSFFEKEKEHIEGFSPELAVVTHGGGEKLEEPLVVRPTSETIIGYMYSKWIQSWRDLPVIKGTKSDSERFAGAQITTSIEGMMQDKRALQSGTSHYFGQNFARAFNIQFVDQSNTLQYCETTSWGLSTRIVGAIIMTHGDDQGLVLPPRLAPIQAVIVPIFKNDAEKGKVMEVAERVFAELRGANIRTRMDDRDNVSSGFKFNDWEMRGVPVRVEIGPRDVEKGSVALARRDRPGREGKSFVEQANLATSVAKLLGEIQHAMLARAIAFRDANIHEPRDYEDLKTIVQDGWALAWWCGSKECEARVKEDTRATTRVIPLEQPGGQGTCAVCGGKAEKKVYFARAY